MLKHRRLVRHLPFVLTLALAGVLATTVLAFPNASLPWLTYKGVGNDTESAEYYTAISAPATFSAWKALYGFDGVNETRAVYYNAGDLGFGRDMHCRRSGADVACYVLNHGLGAGGPADLSVNAAVSGQNALPAVAMVYRNALSGGPNDVSFYIYDQGGNRINKVALDSQGDKYVPHLCLPCHGGNYNSTANSVSDAQFLPFDAPSFRYSAQPGFTLADQQEAFRRLNHMVRDTNPTALITELIDGWYSNNVHVPGTTLNDNFVAPGYANNGGTGIYNSVVKHYCRTCHIAQGFTLATPADVSAAQYAVFTGFYMPHAELTNHNFWSGSAPAYLANDRGWSLRVTKTADTNDGVCNADCSLREAIIAANASSDVSIITFNLNGTFARSLSGADDTAALGDLDITQPLILLGNGAHQTIISASGLDRVFHILGATTNVVIQGVTIQGGNAAGSGGGILNGGNLTVNRSVLRNNTSSSGGAALYNQNGAVAEFNGSTLGPSNAASGAGGAAYNEGLLSLQDSTVSGNSAGSAGGGLYNFASGDVITVTNSTIISNSAVTAGGGMRNFQGTVLLKNSFVAGNTSVSLAADCENATQATSLGYNLLGQNGSANGCPTIGTDLVLTGTIEKALNTNLVGQLGGVTYHALIPGSPALDRIPLGANCSLPIYDQRQVTRPVDGNADGSAVCDVGAREFVRASLSTASDVVADDGLCSLREAVTAANTGQASGLKGGECPASPDVIELSLAGPYELTQGQLTVTGAVTIFGNGQTIRRASGNARLFEVKAGGNLNLREATLRDGNIVGITTFGAAAAVSEDQAGALAAGDVTALSDDYSGGGVYVNPGGVANILNSAIIGNSTNSWGGGIANLGTLNLANSTVSGNSASGDSGGINNRGTANLTHVTVTNNIANANNDSYGDGGGLGDFGGTTTVKNSLIAGNLGDAGSVNSDAFKCCSGSIVSANYNLIGDDTGSGGSFNGPNDLVGTSASPLDPRLDPLTGNPAFHPLRSNSPALDRIPPGNCVYLNSLGNPLFTAGAPVGNDQRGVVRPVAGACDVGAVEALRSVFLPLVLRQ